MNNFFDNPDTKWVRPHGALHFYAVPERSNNIQESYQQITAALRDFPYLALQPQEYLHVTLRRLEVYEGQEPDRWDDLLKDLEERLSALSRFDLQFTSPVLTPASVAAESVAPSGWHELQAAFVAAFSSAGLDHVLTPAPPIPHYSLAYSKEKAEAAPLQAALGKQIYSSSMTVETVNLVSVDQDREAGIFSFRTLKSWPLR